MAQLRKVKQSLIQKQEKKVKIEPLNSYTMRKTQQQKYKKMK